MIDADPWAGRANPEVAARTIPVVGRPKSFGVCRLNRDRAITDLLHQLCESDQPSRDFGVRELVQRRGHVTSQVHVLAEAPQLPHVWNGGGFPGCARMGFDLIEKGLPGGHREGSISDLPGQRIRVWVARRRQP